MVQNIPDNIGGRDRMTEKRSRSDKVRDILPILWSSYEHMYEVRDASTANGINYLMIVATFLPVFCLTLYTAFERNPAFLVPIVFQVAALLILLKRFFIQGQIPWLELEKTLSQLDDNSFDAALFATLKATENDTWKRLEAFRTIIKRALFLLVFSLFLLGLASLFMLLKGAILLYIATALLVGVFSLLYLFYKESPTSQAEEDEKRFKSEIEKWLQEQRGKSNVGSGPPS